MRPALLFPVLYFLAGILEITGEWLHCSTLIYIAKPLLMVFLGLYALQQKAGILLLAGLLFALSGDVFLMFPEEIYFLAGLGSFLLMQGCYIFIFRNLKRKFKTNSATYSLYIWVFTCYYLVFSFLLSFQLIYNKHYEMILPILVYGFVLTLTGITATKLYYSFPARSSLQIMVGACLFILSDTLIGLHNFMIYIPYSGVFIMFTYISAQFLIVAGCLKMKKNQA